MVDNVKLTRLFKKYLGSGTKMEYEKMVEDVYSDSILMTLLFQRILRNSNEFTVIPIPTRQDGTEKIYLEILKNKEIREDKKLFLNTIRSLESIGHILKEIVQLEHKDLSKVNSLSHTFRCLDDFIMVSEYIFETFDLDIVDYIDCYYPFYLRDESEIEYVKEYIVEYIDELNFRKQARSGE